MTGEAKYAADYKARNLVHGWVVSSAVARGRITAFDAADPLRLPGILHVFTHENMPQLASADEDCQDDVAPSGSPFRPLHKGEIKYSAQPVALVVAETLESARYAASLIRIEYEPKAQAAGLHQERERASERRV